MNNENSKLGQHFKETFSDFRAEPSPGVWEKLSQHPSLTPSPKPAFFSPAKLIITAAAVTTVAVVAWFSLTKSEDNTQIKKTSETEISSPSVKSPQSTTETTGTEVQTQTKQGVASNINDPSPVSVTDNKIEPKTPAKTESKLDKPEQPAVLTPKTTANTFPAITVQPGDSPAKKLQPHATVVPEPQAGKAPAASSPVEVCPDQVICKGESATLWATGGEAYIWSNGESSSTITVSPDKTTVYSLTVTDAIGETTTDNIEVKVSNCEDLYVPNAFTPDGDAHNDEFKAFGENIQKFNMLIFARNGQQVFESSDINQGWDGKVRGNMGEPGTYIYKIQYTNANGESKVKKGNVNLIR